MTAQNNSPEDTERYIGLDLEPPEQHKRNIWLQSDSSLFVERILSKAENVRLLIAL